MFITLIITSYNAFTQTLKSDSTLMPNRDLEKVYRAAERGKLYKDEVYSKNRQIDILNKRIANKDSSISILKDQVSIQEEIAERNLSNFKLEQIKSKQIQASFDAFKKASDKALKKQKVNSTFKTIGIAIIGAAAGILLIN